MLSTLFAQVFDGQGAIPALWMKVELWTTSARPSAQTGAG
jgi:hypothetical protein